MAAQRLKEDEISSVADMGLAGFYIIKLKNKTSIDEKKFDSEKNEFSLRLLEQKKQEYFTKFIEELKTKARMF
jgi:F0F1-type ATP synthase gamma subunit